MHPRIFVVAVPFFLLLLSISASGTVQQPDLLPLAAAAAKMRAGDFAGAREAALQATVPGRNFLAGVAAYRLNLLEESLEPLRKGGEELPQLADYTLYYRADALHRLGRSAEALALLATLQKEHPQSTLLRKGELLEGDILFARQDYPRALAAYERFIEKYASGTDAVGCMFNAASCRENIRDTRGAAAAFRSFWLNYPASPLADRAADNLRRLAEGGEKVAPYTAEELFRRGGTQYDLKHYADALKTFDQILSMPELTAEFRGKVLLKKGIALFRSRRFSDAEQLFASPEAAKGAAADDLLYWRGRALDRLSRSDQAAELFLAVAEKFPKSDLADDSLYEAALIRKTQGQRDEALRLLGKIIADYPKSNLRNRILWQTAWTRYLDGDLTKAREAFRHAAEIPELREKALYWLGRAQQAAGENDAAAATMGTLAGEYPYGFYTVRYLRSGKPELKPVGPQPLAAVPPAAGYQRGKLLISLGMFDEARQEIYRERKGKKVKDLGGLARLYAEMDDYSVPYNLAVQEHPGKGGSTPGPVFWSIWYPRPFDADVVERARDNRLSENLVYSVIRAESGFSPTIASPAGAVGLMQLMPATAKMTAGKELTRGDLTTPRTNIRFGTRHLRDLLDSYQGNAALAVAAYNAGSGNVARWVKRFGSLREDEFIENIPFTETRDYVKKVLTGADIYGALYPRTEPDGTPAAATPAPPAPALPASSGSEQERAFNRVSSAGPAPLPGG